MKLYRVSYTNEQGEHAGYEFFSSKKEANKSINNFLRGSFNNEEETTGVCDLEEIEFSLTKKSLLNLLNNYANYPNNG